MSSSDREESASKITFEVTRNLPIPNQNKIHSGNTFLLFKRVLLKNISLRGFDITEFEFFFRKRSRKKKLGFPESLLNYSETKYRVVFIRFSNRQ